MGGRRDKGAVVNPRPFALERFFARYEFTTRYLLCSSDPEPLAVRDLLALEPGSAELLTQLGLGYTESRGGAPLRAAIASLYERGDPEHVLAHCGAEEAVFTLMHAILQPGDHVIVQFPSYQSHYSIPLAIGATVTQWNSDLAAAGAPNVEELEHLIRPSTRAIVLTTPNNPTGYPLDRAQMDAIVRAAGEHDLWLVVDEVYRGLEREAERLPAASDLYERGVSIGALSKAYGLPGLRIGWISTRDRRLYDAMAELKDYLSICNGAAGEFLATLALRHSEMLIERVRRLTAANLDRLDEFFTRRHSLFEWSRPRAGTTAFPRYLGGSSEAFCTRLVERAGVLLLPSTAFDAGDERFRVGYGRTNLPEALVALDAFLENEMGATPTAGPHESRAR